MTDREPLRVSHDSTACGEYRKGECTHAPRAEECAASGLTAITGDTGKVCTADLRQLLASRNNFSSTTRGMSSVRLRERCLTRDIPPATLGGIGRGGVG
jgi:hypothetical protein